MERNSGGVGGKNLSLMEKGKDVCGNDQSGGVYNVYNPGGEVAGLGEWCAVDLINMIDPTAAMMAELTEIAKTKPRLKADQLILFQQYPICKISRPEGTNSYGSVLIESVDFAYYLPSCFKDTRLANITIDDGYSFSIEKTFETKNNKISAEIAFYKNSVRLGKKKEQ